MTFQALRITFLVVASVVIVRSAVAREPDRTRPGPALEARLRGVEAREALTNLATCYGRAQDLLFLTRWREGAPSARSKALPAFRECFTDHVTITATFFGNDAEPFAVTHSLSDWIDLQIGFGAMNQISSTRHLIGNIKVEATRRGGRFTAASVTPHFQAGTMTSAEPSNLLIIGSYRARVVRRGGRFKIDRFFVDAEEIQSVVGLYPFGFAPPATE